MSTEEKQDLPDSGYATAVERLEALERSDAYSNTSLGIGSSTYDRGANTIQVPTSQFTDEELETYYIDNDIAATVVDRPVEDALRQGYALSWPGADSQLLSDVVRWGEEQYKVSAHVEQARKWARLFGGAGLFIGADDGQSLDEPLQVGAPVSFLRPYPKVDLDAFKWYDDVEDLFLSKFGLPRVFRTRTYAYTTHRMTDIHESRFHIFQGILTTQRRFRENKGWGDSVLNRVIPVLRRFDSSWISIMELLTDASVMIYYIKEFMTLLESGNFDALVTRLRLINQQKNSLRPMVLDADGERVERLSPELTDVSNILTNSMIRMSAASDGQPVSVLFGQAPAGLNATPEGDQRNWYDRVGVERNKEAAPGILHIYRVLLAQPDSPTNGEVPKGMKVEFPSLWQATPEQQAALYQLMSTGDGVYLSQQVVSPEEVAIHRQATVQGNFGFPNIDIEKRREILKQMEDPTKLMLDPDEVTEMPETKLPSNSVANPNE